MEGGRKKGRKAKEGRKEGINKEKKKEGMNERENKRKVKKKIMFFFNNKLWLVPLLNGIGPCHRYETSHACIITIAIFPKVCPSPNQTLGLKNNKL